MQAPATANRRSGTAGKSRPGFTLIELVLVLFVLALASAVALPNFRPALDRTRAEAGVRRTASFLDGLRGEAVRESREVTVRIDLEERTLTSTAGEGETAKVRTWAIPASLEPVAAEPEELRYFPPGYSSGFTLTLRDGRQKEYRLQVSSFTGLAQVTSGAGTGQAGR